MSPYLYQIQDHKQLVYELDNVVLLQILSFDRPFAILFALKGVEGHEYLPKGHYSLLELISICLHPVFQMQHHQ